MYICLGKILACLCLGKTLSSFISLLCLRDYRGCEASTFWLDIYREGRPLMCKSFLMPRLNSL